MRGYYSDYENRNGGVLECAPKCRPGVLPPTCRFHAGECVRGLPSVFDISKKPWINVNGASPDAIVDQIKRCPSGALTYEPLKQ